MDFALPFWICSLVLLVATVGAVLLTHRGPKAARRQKVRAQLAADPSAIVTLHQVKTGEGAP